MMEQYERVVIKLFEHCGFTYDPGPHREPGQSWILEVAEIPYADFDKKVLPWWWMRPVALHLFDTSHACETASKYIARIPDFLLDGAVGVPRSWLKKMVSITVCDELRAHVFWFLTFSETIRDKLMSKLVGIEPSLIPCPVTGRYKARLDVKTLCRRLAVRSDLSRPDAEWIIQQLSDLDLHCRIILGAINKLIAEPETDRDTLVQRFTNTQAAFLCLARVLIEADVAVAMWDECVIDFEQPN